MGLPIATLLPALVETANSLIKLFYEKQKQKPDQQQIDLVKQYQEAYRELDQASNMPDDQYDDVTVNTLWMRYIETIQQLNRSISVTVPDVPRL